MKPKSKRIMGLFLALVMIIGCIPLNSMKVYAADVYPVEINSVNFPDDDFRNIVKEWGDANHDGWLSKEEAGEPESINNYSGKAPVKDLKGLEYFYNAKEILFKNAKLTNVDLSKNPNLERVILDNNQITKLDISNNLKLKELSLKGNNIDKLSSIKFGYNNALEKLNLSENYFTKLDLRSFPNLKKLECSGQKSKTELMELLMQSKKLEYLDCSHNTLTDLDLTKSTELVNLICNNNSLTSLDFSNSKKIDIFQSDNRDQYYAIGPTFPYPVSKLPGNFNPAYVRDLEGATIQNGAFYLNNNDVKEITYIYDTGSMANTPVKLGISGFLGVLEVHDINSKAKEGLTRLTFDAGDGTIDGKPKKALDVNALLEYAVTELQVQIKRMQPIANDPNKVFMDWFPEIPQTGQVNPETYYARYTDKVKASTDPNAGLVDGYTRIAFDAGQGNAVDGSRYKIIDVVNGTKWNDPALQSKLPQEVICGDKTKEFKTWSQEILNDDSVVGTGLFEARYTLKDALKIGTDPSAQTPEGYTRIIFDAGEGNTVEGNRYKVIDVREDLTWSHTKVANEAPTEAKYKDSTRVFDKWNPNVPISTKKVEKQTFIAVYKDVETGSKVYKFEPTSADKPVDERDAKIPDKYKKDGKLDTTKYSIISFKLPENSRFIYMGKIGKKTNTGYPVENFFDKSFNETTSFIIPRYMLWRDFRSDLGYDYENSPVAVYVLHITKKGQGCQFEFYGFKNGLPNDNDVLNNGRIFEADFRLKEKIILSRKLDNKIDNYILVSSYDRVIKAPVSIGYGTIKAHGNGGTINGKTDHEIYANVAYDLTFAEIIKHLPDPYREGYKFKYWSESPEEGSPEIDGNKIYNEKTAHGEKGSYTVDVYAQYEEGLPDIIENPTKTTPQGYVRVTFKAGEGIEKLNSTKFYDVKKGTSLREAYYPEVTLKATHDNLVWSVAPGTPINSTTEIEAKASLKGLLKIGTDPKIEIPNGYIRVTFDAGENNTIDGENRYKVIDVLTGTGWDNEAVKGQIPTTATCKETTKEFDNWNETVPTNGPVEAKTFTAKYKDKKKVVEVDSTSSPQEGYVRIMFNAADGLVDGKATKAFDVLKGTTYGDTALKDIIKKLVAVPTDTTKEFNKWTPDVNPTDQVENNKIFTATYKAKELVKAGTDPNAAVPNGYTRVKFDAGEGNTIDGTNRYKVIDVLTGTAWDNKAVKDEIPEKAINQDTKQEFDKWSETVPTAGTVEAKTFTATYKAKEIVKAGTDPNAAVPNGYTRVKFDAGEGNTIDGTNRYKVIDVLTGTAWDNKAVKDEIPEKAKYKDATKIFTEWDSTVPTTGPVEEQDFTAIYRTPAPTPDPTNPIVGPVDPTDPNGGKPADPSKYYVVTFVSADTTMGTVDAKNTAYVLKTETKTLADITAPKTTAVQGYEFEKWEPALDKNTTIAGDMEVKAYFKQKGTTPQNPPVVGPVDPQDPNGGKPADPSKYYVVTFVSADTTMGTVDAKNTAYVLKTETKTLADLARFAPAAIPYYGYEFAGWSPYLYGNPTIIDSNMVIYARFEELYTPSYPDPYERRRPRRKYNYRDDRYDRDDNEEEKIEEAKVYDKLEAILFINNNLMQKSVNGVVSQVRMDIAPFIYQSRTMLPIRFVAESLGFMVTWDANTRTVYLIDKENIVQIPVDTNNIIVNGNTFVSDVKPMIKNNRTMLPVANIARALGLEDGKDILWDAVRAMVTLKRNVLK